MEFHKGWIVAFIFLVILISCQVSVVRINGSNNYVSEQESDELKADSVKINLLNKNK